MFLLLKTYWRWVAVVLVASSIFTFLTLQWSLRDGRLSQDLTYDDAGYISEGLVALRTLERTGFANLIRHLSENPPHSPFSTTFAMLSFFVFGVHDWAPYALNGLLLSGLLLLLSFYVPLERGLFFKLAVLLMLFVPISFHSIHDFRPDFALALVTAAGVLVYSGSTETSSNRSRLWATGLAGLLFGSAFLIKPTFFPHTAALFLVSFGLSAALFLAHWRFRPSAWKQVLLEVLVSVAGLAIAIPYYLKNWRHVFDYFYLHSFGADAKLSTLTGSPLHVLIAFLTNPNISSGMDAFVWFFFGTAISALILGILSKDYLFAKRLGSILCSMIVSLAIWVYGRHANPFFGMTYQILLLVSALMALSWFYKTVEFKNRIIGLYLIAFLGFTAWSLTHHQTWRISLASRSNISTNRAFLTAIERDTEARAFGGKPRVFVNTLGAVNALSLHWEAVKDEFQMTAFDLLASDDFDQQLKHAQESDYVITGTPDAPDIWSWFPVAKTQEKMVETLGKDCRFKLVSRMTFDRFARSGSFLLFANEEVLAARGTFQLPVSADVLGMLPIEGPYPQWNLGRVRWGLFPETEIRFSSRETGMLELSCSIRGLEGQKIDVFLNDRLIGNHDLPANGWQSIHCELRPQLGENRLELKYAKADPSDGARQHAALFRVLCLRKKSD